MTPSILKVTVATQWKLLMLLFHKNENFNGLSVAHLDTTCIGRFKEMVYAGLVCLLGYWPAEGVKTRAMREIPCPRPRECPSANSNVVIL